MAEIDHRKAALDFAQLALRGDYVNEAYPQRLAMLAEVHALLVAQAIGEATRILGSRGSPLPGDQPEGPF